MGWFQLVLIARKIVQILIDSGVLNDMPEPKLAEAQAFAAEDPAKMRGFSFAEIIEIIQKLLPILEEIWAIIQRENEGITK